MTRRVILEFPEPLLKQVSQPVEEVTDEIRRLALDMCESMYDAPGIGLAAPQVGELLRVVVVDTKWGGDDAEGEPSRSPLVLINPAVVEKEGEIIWEEGCLSVPEFTADVKRAQRIVVEALDLDGKEISVEAEELEAVCIQHEIDHLDGILFIDHLSRLKRNMYIKKRKKLLLTEQEDAASGRRL